MNESKERYFSSQEVEAIFQRASRFSLNSPEDYISYSQLILIAEEVGISSLDIDAAILDSQSALSNSNPAPTLTPIESSKNKIYFLGWLKTILNILISLISTILTWKLILSSFELLQQHITILLQSIFFISSLNINNIALTIFHFFGVILIAMSRFFYSLFSLLFVILTPILFIDGLINYLFNIKTNNYNSVSVVYNLFVYIIGSIFLCYMGIVLTLFH